MPTITSSKFREYMFLTHPSPASISRLMIQRKKTTRTKKQAVRQTESSKHFCSDVCRSKLLNLFLSFYSQTDTELQKTELCLALQVQIKPRVCQIWHVLNAVQGNAAEELPTLPPSIPRGRDGLQRWKGPGTHCSNAGVKKQHQGKGRLRVGGFVFILF